MYSPGNVYRKGWDDRLQGLEYAPGQYTGVLYEEYIQGYNDCHQQIIENERRAKLNSPLQGHPLYKEAHDDVNKQFLTG